MARGETAADGRFSTALNMVPIGRLADPGDGTANAFNTIVVAEDPSGGLAIRHEIMRVGERNPVVIDLDAQDGTTSLVQPQADASPALSCQIGGLCQEVLGYSYRYLRVLAFNSAAGMATTFLYTFTDSTAQQTQAKIAFSWNDVDFSAGNYMMEGKARTVEAPWNKSGDYHRYVWANYRWRHMHYWYCDPYAYCTQWYEWQPWYFQGTVSDYDPDKGPSGKVIGTITYTQPTFDTNPNHQVKLTDATSPWTRSSGQIKEYGFSLDVAGMLALTDKATYGSITWVRWTKISGCSKTRVLWGDGTDPVNAPIVQASCRSV